MFEFATLAGWVKANPWPLILGLGALAFVYRQQLEPIVRQLLAAGSELAGKVSAAAHSVKSDPNAPKSRADALAAVTTLVDYGTEQGCQEILAFTKGVCAHVLLPDHKHELKQAEAAA